MAFIDGTVVNVALPVLQADLQTTVSQMQWVVEAYALFLAALILVGGSLGDHFGRRRVFSIGVGIFAAASVACGLAPNTTLLILGRAIQGIGGALLIPGSLAIISASFDRDQRGQAIGTWSAFTAITAALGPVLGGWLVENLDWRWVFFLNVPLALITLAITFWRVPESWGKTAKDRLDWPGAALATLGLGGLVFGLIEQSNLGFEHPLTLGALAVGVLALLAFVMVESRQKSPMMPLDIFQSRTFRGANLLTLFVYGGLGGALFFVPFNLIQVQGYSATAAGAANTPMVLIIFLLSRWAGGLVDRYGAKLPLIVGPLIAAAGYLLFAVPGIGGSYWLTFFPPMVVLGLGMAITAAPLTTAVMGSVEEDEAGVASGVNNAVSRSAGLLALAVLGIFALNTFNSSLDTRLAPLNLDPAAQDALDVEREKLGGATAPATLPEVTRSAVSQAIDEAFVATFRLVMFIAALMALAGAFFAWWLVEGKVAPEPVTPPLQAREQVTPGQV